MSRLLLTDDDFAEKWIDPLPIITARREKTDAFRHMLAGRSAFLVCSGPSANEIELEQLNGRGIWSMAVNNMAAHHRFRPNAFICSDPPGKFSDTIWFDPGIMKFVPTPKLKGRRGGLRRKLPDGTFERLDVSISKCPNVWGFQRWSWLSPDDEFFLTDGACWGNHNAGMKKTGQPKTVCTPLLAIRLLYYLGARTVYLVGMDFTMSPDYGYAFDQGRTVEACLSNNNQFSIVNGWLCDMQGTGVFKRFGLKLYNCFERSGLRAFPYVPFDEAIIESKGSVQDRPSLSGWYEKGKK